MTDRQRRADARAGRPAARRGPGAIPVVAWLLVAFALVSFARVVTGADDIDSAGTIRAADPRRHPDPAGRPGRAVVRACRRGQHRPRGQMILGTWGAATSPTATARGRASSRRAVRRARRPAARAGHRDLRRRPHRLRRRDQHHGGRASPRSWPRPVVLRPPGRRPDAVAAGRRPAARSTLPAVSDGPRRVNDKHWFLVSDLASVVGALTSDLSLADHPRRCCSSSRRASCCGTPSFGLRLRSCGESPSAAESLGVNVYRYKYIAVLVSGALAGLGGGFLALVARRARTRTADRRPRLHRPGGDDLRQLAARRHAARRRRCSATPTRCSCAGGGAVHALLLLIAIVLLAYGALPAAHGQRAAPAIVTVRRGRAVRGVVLPHRHGARATSPA